MSKKQVTLIITAICLLFLMSGCSTSSEPISLDTTFHDMTQEGVFTALLTYPLAQAINFLSSKVGVFFSITIVAVALNAIIIAITFKSNVAMQKMQALQPEIQKIQMKYEGRADQASQQRMSQELQAVYKKNGINPLGSMVATFIQLPVLFAMYAAVRRATSVTNGTFLGATLSLTPREALAEKEWVLIVIYVLMVVMQIISINCTRWIQESRNKKEAERKHKHYEKPVDNNKMMTYSMVIFIAFIMISWPTALSLYYCIYSCITIAKTFLIDYLTHRETEEK